MQRIERYVSLNQSARDTAVGIASWWLGPGRSVDLETVERALARLVLRGIIERTTNPDGTITYAARRPTA